MHVDVKSLAASAVFFAATALSAEPDPGVRLEQSRAAANAHFKTASAGLATAHDAVEKAETSFRSCKNGRLQLQFSDSLARLETARKTLEKGRRETQSFRRKLEDVREDLEARSRHHRKEVGAGGYSERLLTEYVTPFETQLVPLLETYTAGITEYASSLDRYASLCAKPDLTAAEGRTFVGELAPSIDALSTKAVGLVTAATKARQATAVSAK